MIGSLNFSFNPYDRIARLIPALWSALPLSVSIALLFPEIGEIWAVVSGLILFSGAITILTHISRIRTESLEPQLFKLWGGMPSISLLRHSDTRLNPLTKARYREFLERTVPNLKLASSEEEESSPKDADIGYKSANQWLLSKTRDRGKFELLFRENINYGFRRNIWALKPFALFFNLIATVILFCQVYPVYSFSKSDFLTRISYIDTEHWVTFLFIVAHSLYFIFLIRREWIRKIAFAYAYQLLEACDTLSNEQYD